MLSYRVHLKALYEKDSSNMNKATEMDAPQKYYITRTSLLKGTRTI